MAHPKQKVVIDISEREKVMYIFIFKTTISQREEVMYIFIFKTTISEREKSCTFSFLKLQYPKAFLAAPISIQRFTIVICYMVYRNHTWLLYGLP